MKKLIALVLAALMLTLSCAALAETKTYNTVEPGKFIYATSPDFPPFEDRDDADNVIGIEPDLIAIICERLGLTPEAFPIDFDAALEAPGSGKTDAVVSGVTIREDRKASLDFTIPYVTITQAIVCKAGAGITMDNLGEKTIGVQTGTTGHIYAVDDFGEDHTLAYDKYSLAFQALLNGQVDCILVDNLVGQAYAKRLPGLEVVTTTYEPEEFGFGFAKDKYPELLADFNAVLQELIDNGTVEEIVLKWNE
ncbi:MAG: transporter substrate-binding domain-containing protein [Clostridia bacterium]|nr:transporter substrate-binding domain-containing protein [Clostridia bacterium]